MSAPDPYKVLQVDPEAEVEVIEAAYRRLARKYHPDVAPGPDARDRMVRINQAWEQLRDPVRRAATDRARARAAMDNVGGPASGAGQDPGGGGRPAGRDRGWPIPGMRDPSDASGSRPRAQTVSRDWTTGRSTSGSGYDPSTMGAPQGPGAAGPPPGNPTGSVLNFGRYAGWSLGEIARADIEYLEWLDRMPIGRIYQHEIDGLLRRAGRRISRPSHETSTKGLFRRR
jgi:curved DNA-binding protein CbpA